MEAVTKKIETIFEKIEQALDRFFDGQINTANKMVEKAFEYTYRETTKGVFGLFSTPEQISHAAKETVKKGYTNFDCLTPFPVHGLEFDMGLKRSRIPHLAFWFAMIGLALAIYLQTAVHELIVPVTFSHALDALPNLNSYPMNFGGKPTFSWPAMLPICFELAVLFAGPIGMLLGLLVLAKLPKASRKILHPSITDDKFALWIPSDSANFDEAGVKAFLTELGAEDITTVNEK